VLAPRRAAHRRSCGKSGGRGAAGRIRSTYHLERSLYFRDICSRTMNIWHTTRNGPSNCLTAAGRTCAVWEWHYLNRLFRQEVLSLTHSQRVLPGLQSRRFAPRRLHGFWGVNEPGEVKVWDAATGKEIWTLRGHSSPVMSVAFSPDGKLLASTAVYMGTG